MPNALAKAHLLILNQIISRGFTFFLNLFVVRQVGLVVYGISSINLYLLYTIILYVSREPFRKSASRCFPILPNLKAITGAIPFQDDNQNQSLGNNVQKTQNLKIDDDNSDMTSISKLEFQKWVNVSWLSFFYSLLFSCILIPVYSLIGVSEDTSAVLYSDYTFSLYLYASSAIIECFAEPIHLYAITNVMIEVRVKAESIGNLLRCITTGISALYFHHTLLSFTYGQVVYSLTYTIVYYSWIYTILAKKNNVIINIGNNNNNSAPLNHKLCDHIFITSLSCIFPAKVKTQYHPNLLETKININSAINTTNILVRMRRFLCRFIMLLTQPFLKHMNIEYIDITNAFWIQSIEKLLLTEGEKTVMLILQPISAFEQGVFSIVQNLGSLILRFIFQPLEEASAIQFSKEASEIDTSIHQWVEKVSSSSTRDSTVKYKMPSTSAYQAYLRLAFSFSTLSRFVTLVALIMMVFMPGNSSILFSILYGKTWSISPAPSAFIFYTYTLYVFALNGIFEAFLYALAPKEYIYGMNKVLVFISVIYIVISSLVTTTVPSGYGAHAFIIMNAFAMSLRIIFSLEFIALFFGFKLSNQILYITRGILKICHVPASLVDNDIVLDSNVSNNSDSNNSRGNHSSSSIDSDWLCRRIVDDTIPSIPPKSHKISSEYKIASISLFNTPQFYLTLLICSCFSFFSYFQFIYPMCISQPFDNLILDERSTLKIDSIALGCYIPIWPSIQHIIISLSTSPKFSFSFLIATLKNTENWVYTVNITYFFIHIIIQCILLAVVVATIFWCETELIHDFKKLFFAKTDTHLTIHKTK